MSEKISNPEQYYFWLAQALMAVFSLMGGADKYRRELNYLTNPAVRKGLQLLNKRVLKFLANINYSVIMQKQELAEVYEQLVEWDKANGESYLDENKCEDAFYRGLHEDNFLNKR